MTLRDRIEAAPDKLAAARVALEEVAREHDMGALAAKSKSEKVRYQTGAAFIRALRDSLGGEG